MDVDIIIYVGSFSFKQTKLIKVPTKYEPKTLRYCGKVLGQVEGIDEFDFFNINSWDFGLKNFDVR